MFHWGKKERVDPDRTKALSLELKAYIENNFFDAESLSDACPMGMAYDGYGEVPKPCTVSIPDAAPGHQVPKAPGPDAAQGYAEPYATVTFGGPSSHDDIMYHPSHSAPSASHLPAPSAPPTSYNRRLEDILKEADESFMDRLLRYADERGFTDAQLYNKSHIDKRHFGKIKNGEIKPVKDVVIAFILGLELNLDEAEDLLCSAGFTLSSSIKFDLAIRYFIKNGIYDTIVINEVLEDQNLPTLRYY